MELNTRVRLRPLLRHCFLSLFLNCPFDYRPFTFAQVDISHKKLHLSAIWIAAQRSLCLFFSGCDQNSRFSSSSTGIRRPFKQRHAMQCISLLCYATSCCVIPARLTYRPECICLYSRTLSSRPRFVTLTWLRRSFWFSRNSRKFANIEFLTNRV